MKVSLIATLAVSIGTSLFSADLHTLTSADGSKTMEAAIENYQPSTGSATINVKGRRMTVPVSAFQVEDKLKFDNWYQTFEVGRKLALSFDEMEVDGNEKKTSNAKVTQFDSTFKIKVRNNGQQAFEDVKLKYRVFYYRDKDKGPKESTHEDGELDLTNISPRETKELSTESISLTKVRPLPATQCVGGG